MLNIASNAAGGNGSVALTGTGVAPARRPPPAPRAQPADARASSARRTGMSRARVLRRGLRLTMRLPQGTEIVKISVLPRPQRQGATASRCGSATASSPSQAGLYRMRLDSRALRRRLKAGLYQVNVTPGREQAPARGDERRTRIRITRR